MFGQPHPTFTIHSPYSDTAKMAELFTSRVTSASWTRSVSPWFDTCTVRFKCAMSEVNALVNTGDWIVIADPAGVAYTFNYIVSVEYTVVSDSMGAVSCAGTLQGVSWMELLGRATVYVPVGWTETQGTLLSVVDWANMNAASVNDKFSGNLGAALQAFHRAAAQIRLPDTLGGELLSEAIPIVHDDDTAAAYTDRGRAIDPLNFAGMVPDATGFRFTETKLGEMYRRTWCPESNLIDLYPSLEVTTPETSSEAGTVPAGTAPLSKLAQVLKARPVLIYTLKPFRPESLQAATLTYVNFKGVDTRVNAGAAAVVTTAASAAAVGSALVGPFAAAASAAAQAVKTGVAERGAAQQRSLQFDALFNVFNRKTWDPGAAVPIPRRVWSRLSMAYNDEARVNTTTITIGGDGVGLEAATSLGLPISNYQSAMYHGLRLSRPTWPFTIPNARTSENWFYYLRAVAAQMAQFYMNAHRMASGSFTTVGLDAVRGTDGHRVLPLKHGQLFVLEVGDGVEPLLGYCESVQHDLRVAPDGAVSLTATVSFSRGVAVSDVLTQYAKVPIGDAPAEFTLTRQPASIANSPFTRPAASAFTIGAWSGYAALTNPEQTIRYARAAGVTVLDVFVNNKPSSVAAAAFSTYFSVSELTKRLKKLTDAGLTIWVSTWVTPDQAWVDGMADIGRVATAAGVAGVTLDIEEPWTLRCKGLGLSDTTSVARAKECLASLRTTWSGVVGGTGVVYAPPMAKAFIGLCDVAIPQCYATYRNTANLAAGQLEATTARLWAGVGNLPVILGAAANDFPPTSTVLLPNDEYRIDGAYGVSGPEAVAAAVKGAWDNGFRELRYWRLETLVYPNMLRALNVALRDING